MSVIATLGSRIIFRVSDKDALLLQTMTRQVAGRWTTHTTFGTKPRAEFLGPDNQSISISVYLSSTLGVRPRNILEAITDMVESGTAEYFIVGNRPVGANRFKIASASEAWNKIYNRGELAKATVSLTLEEYT